MRTKKRKGLDRIQNKVSYAEYRKERANLPKYECHLVYVGSGSTETIDFQKICTIGGWLVLESYGDDGEMGLKTRIQESSIRKYTTYKG